MKSTLQLLKTIFCLISLFVVCNKNYSQPGTLDASFGNGGIVLTNHRSDVGGTYVRSTQDNKLLLAGTLSYDNNVDSIFLAKYNLNGNSIKSFGNNGVIKYKGIQADTKIDEQNRILVAGSEPDTTSNSITSRSILLRFRPNGNIDSTFGSNGKAIIKIKSDRLNSGDDFNVYHVTITANKKIIVTGEYTISHSDAEEFAIAVIQFKTDGSVDSSFGDNGQKLIWFDRNRITPLTLTLQADNKILIGGQLLDFKNAKEYFILVRLNSNGNLDSSFGINGIVITAATKYNFLRSTAIQNNRIIVAGDVHIRALNTSQCIVRYNLNGEIDTTFGNNGKVITSLPGTSLYGGDIIINPDNKIILLSGNNIITRYTENGKLDHSFGYNGFDSISFNKYSAFEHFSIQEDNKIVITGYTYLDTLFYLPTIFISRINNNVELPVSSSTKQNNTSLEDLQTSNLSKSIIMYPNPATNFIYVDGLKKNMSSNIIITNSNGETINAIQTNQSSQKINLQNLVAGIYYIAIQQDGKTIKQKFIKQ